MHFHVEFKYGNENVIYNLICKQFEIVGLSPALNTHSKRIKGVYHQDSLIQTIAHQLFWFIQLLYG